MHQEAIEDPNEAQGSTSGPQDLQKFTETAVRVHSFENMRKTTAKVVILGGGHPEGQNTLQNQWFERSRALWPLGKHTF